MIAWFSANELLRPHEFEALRFLAASGPHQVGVIDDEEKFAAAFVFTQLIHKGCVVGAANPSGGPTYYLTAKGRAAASAGDATPKSGAAEGESATRQGDAQ